MATPAPRSLHIIAALPLAAMLSGCLPLALPIPPGYEGGSRQNLGEDAGDFIGPAHTTRAEVLLRLGEPEGIATDESWMSYGCAFSRGGVIVGFVSTHGAVLPCIESVGNRRLTVWFDGQGIVTTSQMETKACPSRGDCGVHCLDIKRGDLTAADASAVPDSLWLDRGVRFCGAQPQGRRNQCMEEHGYQWSGLKWTPPERARP